MANLRADNLCGTGGRNAITGAVFFGGDNNTGGLTIADTTDLELGSETNWTIEFWIKLNHSALSDWDVVMGKGSNQSGGTEYEWFVEVMSGDHLVFLSTGAGSPWDFNQQITPALVVGEWYHIAIVRNGSGANTLKSYVNGVQYSTHTSQNIYTGNDTFGIGHFAHTNGLNSDVTLSNVRIVKGTSVYTAAFTPPTSKLTVIPNTVLLCCNDSDDVTQEETGKTITSVGNPVATDDIPPVGVDEGVVFEGDTKVNSQGYMYFPTGNTSQRGRGRAVWFSGNSTVTPAADSLNNTIDYIQIQSGGTAIDFGDMPYRYRRNAASAFSSSTRGINAGGFRPSGSPSRIDTIMYINIATTSNALDFGNLSEVASDLTGLSNETRGMWAGALLDGSWSNQIQYITIASTGNTTDFGDLNEAYSTAAGCASPTRGLIGGGYNNTPATTTNKDFINYITIATTGNTTDFGNLTVARRGPGASSSQTRALWAFGNDPSTEVNTIDYITIATTGDATDFGDYTILNSGGGGSSNGTRGVFGGGYGASPHPKVNVINRVEIATTGNAQDFGDLSIRRANSACTSDSHGGLS